MGTVVVILGFLTLAACAAISRTAARRLFARADDSIKPDLVRVFEEMKTWTTWPLTAMMLAYVAGVIWRRDLEPLWLVILAVAIFLHLLVCQFVIARKLGPLDLPAGFLVKLMIGRNLPYWGLLAVLAAALAVKIVAG